jgi:HSP20 family molecular chaperone IbpA
MKIVSRREFALILGLGPIALKAAAQEGQLTVTIPKKVSAPSASAVQVPVE